jgi:DNA-binding NarL/FixJ family response regulator
MIVDDHEVFRATARELLELDHFEVVADAGSAAEALGLVMVANPEIVLLDVVLPDAIGFDVVPLLHEQPGTVVVLTSSRDRSDYGTRVETSGADGFIPKDELSGPQLRRFMVA